MSLTLPPSAKIYLSLAPCDMRKGFDGLSAQVRNILRLDPFSGAVFLFRGKRGNRLKALVCVKRPFNCGFLSSLIVDPNRGHGPFRGHGLMMMSGSGASTCATRSWKSAAV